MDNNIGSDMVNRNKIVVNFECIEVKES
jgi:hypothetical protein